MSHTAADAVFAGSVPEIYERYFVPLIFEPYAADLARRAAALRPTRMLETAVVPEPGEEAAWIAAHA